MEEAFPSSGWVKEDTLLSNAPTPGAAPRPFLPGSLSLHASCPPGGRPPPHPSPQAISSPPWIHCHLDLERLSTVSSPLFWAVTLLAAHWTWPPGCPTTSRRGLVKLSPSLPWVPHSSLFCITIICSCMYPDVLLCLPHPTGQVSYLGSESATILSGHTCHCILGRLLLPLPPQDCFSKSEASTAGGPPTWCYVVLKHFFLSMINVFFYYSIY